MIWYTIKNFVILDFYFLLHYALIYIDFFVNNIQKKSQLNCCKWRFYHYLRYFFNNTLYRTNSIFTLPPLGAPLNVELANSVLQHDDLCKLYKNSLSTIHFYIILKPIPNKRLRFKRLSTIHFYIILKR